jgi:DNA end-binding protein Ku
VRGWEVSKGEFVIVEDADLEALEQQDTSRSIEITGFVPLEDVDPVFFDRTYFLAPAAAPAARRPYALLLNAMRETGTAGVGRFVLAGKEKLALVRAKGDALVLETLFVAEDVYSQAEIDELVEEIDVKKAELDLARQVIASMASEFDPSELVSEYRSNLRALLEAKLEGREVAVPEPAQETPVVDLMEALRLSVAEAQQRKKGSSGDGKAGSKAPARSRAKAKSA